MTCSADSADWRSRFPVSVALPELLYPRGANEALIDAIFPCPFHLFFSDATLVRIRRVRSQNICPGIAKFYIQGRDSLWRGIAKRESNGRHQSLDFVAVLQTGASTVRPENAFPKRHLQLPAFQIPHDFPVAALLHRNAPQKLSVFSEIADSSPSRAGAGPASSIALAVARNPFSSRAIPCLYALSHQY